MFINQTYKEVESNSTDKSHTYDHALAEESQRSVAKIERKLTVGLITCLRSSNDWRMLSTFSSKNSMFW